MGRQNNDVKISNYLKNLALTYLSIKSGCYQDKLILNDSSEQEFEDEEVCIKWVENAFDKLDSLDREFINNEYFFNAKPYWWEKVYSRATFFRLKRLASRRFYDALMGTR